MPGLEAGWWLAATIAAPALRVMLRRRVARGKEIADRLPERRGLDTMPRPAGRVIWVHAASVGETLSVIPVLEALRQHPVTVLVTTGTVTSARLLQQRCPGTLHRFVPLDVPGWVNRFLDHWRPDAAAFLESELWPNMLRACGRRAIPLMLLNGRLSARSQAGWARAPTFARQVVGAFDTVWAQSDADAGRLRSLGARNVTSPGNLKFAASPLPTDPNEFARLNACLTGPRWLAASTHEGEEAIAAAVHHRLAVSHPGLVTAIAPRHPDRGPAIAAELDALRRGAGDDPPAQGLWIADGLGEMGLLYRLFPTVFVGKSLSGDGGGQNPLEPARFGCALAAGPAMENQADATAALAHAGGLTTVADEFALAEWVDAMVRNPAARAAAGRAACSAAAADAGLPQRAANTLIGMAR